jgi:leucyl-tRNA synthetase
MEHYDHKAIEKKWQEEWRKEKLYRAPESVPRDRKMYILPQLPYPSGEGLHMGHAEVYTACDIYARYHRMVGNVVLQAMGWDAFGLPAENFAIKTNVHPRINTDKAIDTFREQVRSLGISVDWEREVATHNPDYYKWTQWFFLLLYERGLAYRKKQAVNWCEGCKTTLANEQVVNGTCERCGTEVVQKEMEQWFFKITDYADRLYDDLDTVDWPEETMKRQRDWIGRSHGALIPFKLRGSQINADEKQMEANIEVFTTRPDTLFGATYLVISPEKAMEKLQENNELGITNYEEVKGYVEKARKKTELERQENRDKTGVELKGVKAINPGSGEEIPIWVADYVLAGYGTGAVMAVPAHDERDFAFAKQMDLPIRQVVVPCAADSHNPPQEGFDEVKRDTVIVHLRDNSTGKFALLDWHGTLEGTTTAIMGGIEPGQTPEDAVLAEIKEEVALEGVRIVRRLPWITAAKYCASHKKENRCAHSYAFLVEIDNLSTQGEIDASEQATHTLVWVDESQVHSRLTPDHQKQVWKLLHEEAPLTGNGYLINSGSFDGMDSIEAQGSITEDVGGQTKTTYKLRDWLVSRQRFWGAPIPIVYDEAGKPHPVAQEDLPVVLPDDVDFKPTGQSPLTYSKEFQKGIEKTYGKGWRREVDTLDTFVDSSWYYYRYLDPRNERAFASPDALKQWMPVNFYLGGPEHVTGHLLYSRFLTKVLYDAGYIEFDEPFTVTRHQGLILGEDRRKMSKRWGNVINPTDMVERFGADATRMYQMFMGPLEQDKPWDTNGVVGVRRFLEKVWRLRDRAVEQEHTTVAPLLHKTVKKVGEDIAALKFNTAVSQLMIFANTVVERGLGRDQFGIFLKLLAPFAPHFAEELWHELGHATSVHLEPWPEYDPALVEEKQVTVVVQVNGKTRGEFEASRDIVEADARREALALPGVEKWLGGKEPVRVVYIPGRLINIVI